MTLLEEYLNSLQRFGIQPGLDRIRALCQAAGEAHLAYPVVLVGGTNGKGSTCEVLARMAAAAGFRCGLYTSPHLYQWRERIRILEPGFTSAEPFPGMVSEEELDELLSEATPLIERVAAELGQPTEFEVLTLLGLTSFQQRRVDLAIVEVGLGGRWDATNITEPAVSVITNVAMDHCDRLGNTPEEIAADKAHIARPGRSLVTGADEPVVVEVLRAHCARIGARLVVSEPAATVPPGLVSFQWQNLNLAVKVWHEMQFALAHLKLPDQAPDAELWRRLLPRGVPGRFQELAGPPRIVLDTANNPDGAAHLAREIERRQEPGQRLVLVVGILEDKDWVAMLEVLAPLADAVVVTASQSPRAGDPQQQAEVARRWCRQVEVVTPVAAALARAQSWCRPQDLIVVTGSFTTLGELNFPN